MKFFAIALFIFLLNISVGVLNETGILYTEVQGQEEWIAEVKQIGDESAYSETGVSTTGDSFGWGDFIKGFWYFIKAVGMSLIGVYWMYTSFGLAPAYALLFSIPVYLLYIVGIAQFIGNRGMRNMV